MKLLGFLGFLFVFSLLFLGFVDCRCLKARVLGAGVSGLSNAIILQRLGWDVTIHSKASPRNPDDDPYYASPQAGAWWSGAWTEYSYETYLVEMGETVSEPTSTAIRRKAHVLYTSPLPSNLDSTLSHITYADSWRNKTLSDLSFWGDLFVFGYEMDTIVVTAPEYISYLLDQFEKLGGKLIIEEVKRLSDLTNKRDTDLVINCSGLGALTLGDVEDQKVFPERGQVIIARQPQVTEVYRGRGPVDASDPGNFGTYILPRENGEIVLGGTRTANDFDVNVREQDRQDILARCAKLWPPIASAELLFDQVGFRPSREGGIRLEYDDSFDIPVIHNYGHAGGGFEYAWGCASSVKKLVLQRFPSAATCDSSSSSTLSIISLLILITALLF